MALLISGSVLGGIIVGVLIVYVAVVMPKVEEVNVKTQEIVKLKDDTSNNVTKIQKELEAANKKLETYQSNEMTQALADEKYMLRLIIRQLKK